MKKLILILIALAAALCFVSGGGQINLNQNALENPNIIDTSSDNYELPNKPAEITDFFGPWHLSDTKNNLAEFSNLFSCYAEFGASMEIRSNGQMSWYVGAEGGVGTYEKEDNTLHAHLTSDMTGEPLEMNLLLTEEDNNLEITMTVNDISVIWNYGDRE